MTNGEDAYSYGIETDVYIYPADGWTVVLGGSWLQAEYDGGTIDSATPDSTSRSMARSCRTHREYLVNASVEKTLSDGRWRGRLLPHRLYDARQFVCRRTEQCTARRQVSKAAVTTCSTCAPVYNGDFWALQLFATNVFDQNASSFNFSTARVRRPARAAAAPHVRHQPEVELQLVRVTSCTTPSSTSPKPFAADARSATAVLGDITRGDSHAQRRGQCIRPR